MDRSPVFIAGFNQFDIVYIPEKHEIESRFRSENNFHLDSTEEEQLNEENGSSH